MKKSLGLLCDEYGYAILIFLTSNINKLNLVYDKQLFDLDFL
jgi:hypothetical protein